MVLGSSSNADDFSLVSSNDTCKVVVTSPVINGSIEDQLKANCSEVSGLNISGHGVLQIPTGYCSLLPNLTRFEVQSTPADRLTEAFKEDDCQSLKYLLLLDNNLSTLPVAAFRTLKGLDFLELSHNRLENLHPDAFVGLERLTSLGLANNGISQLPDDLFKPLTNLELILLSSNNLKTLDLNLLSTNSKLIGLSCNNCGLTSILPSTSPLHLKTIELVFNELTNITALNGMKSLRWLELAANADLMLDEVEFYTFPNLTAIDLGKVSLYRATNYQNIFPPSLTRLYLYGNSLGCLNLDQLSHLKKLEYLNVMKNGLNALDFERVPTIFPNLKRFDLRRNEFSEEKKTVMKAFFFKHGINVTI
jgi:Leucine-rich repeat (LRR) protein